MDSIISAVMRFLTRNKSIESVPEGYCPTCWGRQEYGGKFYEAVYKEKIDLNNIGSKKGWINAYVKQNLEGIKLKEIEGVRECPSCNLSYRIT